MEKSELPVLQYIPPPAAKGQRKWLPLALIMTFGILIWGKFNETMRGCCAGLFGHSFPLKDGNSPIKWTKCDDVILCATIDVPLDHLDPGAGTATLSLAKYPATSKAEDRLGTLFLNPGGPGGSGVELIYSAASNVSELFDGRYDVVSWDPRGINGTTPRIECFGTQTEQDIYYIHTSQEAPLSIGNLSSDVDLAVLTYQLKYEDARNEALVKLCVERSGAENLRFVGTSTVVRDLELLATTLEGDKPINYWGFSYGTVVGSYFTNMFPDRVGRVVIDGVVNPYLWSTEHPLQWFPEFYNTTYDSYQGFLRTCVEAGPERCALAKENLSFAELSDAIDEWLAKLYDRPLPVPYAQRPGILTKGHVMGFLFRAMYIPRTWQARAAMLEEAMLGNGTRMLDLLQQEVELNKTTIAQTALAFIAVSCTDALPYTDEERKHDIEEMLDSVKKSFKVAPNFATIDFPDLCHLWPVEQKERFTGPWNHTLANDILVIGNTYDPVTPLINAKHVHEWQKNSVLVQHDGFGHCTLAMTSYCTLRILRSYFLNGTLPSEREVFCPVDEPLYPVSGLEADVSAWMQGDISEEDKRIMEIAQGLGKDLEGLIGKGGRMGGKLW
ncbi:alpha/beta-hydrolase [Calocera viscosa TUFC12733]|uniref:Alpha/beta-hydrolase n=1 Tax=Calocera viscosa (strain TUFC12733) TaxID=1330018 RepID=A0A167JK29_CALVF|nr:alpha/beta-hydrolase [Calocera viscosa TUFC12733]